MIETIIGTVGAACTTIATYPQAIKSWKTKQTGDLSLLMYSILTTGVFLWIIYGYMIQDWIVFVANIFTLLPVLTILLLKIKHG